MSNGENIKVGEARGRPMLHWVGKQPLDYVKAFPAQKVEAFNPLNEENNAQGLLFHGDNKDVVTPIMAELVQEGKLMAINDNGKECYKLPSSKLNTS